MLLLLAKGKRRQWPHIAIDAQVDVQVQVEIASSGEIAADLLHTGLSTMVKLVIERTETECCTGKSRMTNTNTKMCKDKSKKKSRVAIIGRTGPGRV